MKNKLRYIALEPLKYTVEETAQIILTDGMPLVLKCPYCSSKLILTQAKRSGVVALRCERYPVCKFSRERATLAEAISAVQQAIRRYGTCDIM
jgi:ssDNA-binding Zn-finger/Zn-ribbon topoisomerase 1